MAWADVQKRGRSWMVSGGLIGLGVVVGYALPVSSVAPKTETGMILAVSGAPGSSPVRVLVTFQQTGSTKQTYQFVQTTPWRATATSKWRNAGDPPCLVPGSGTPEKATIGVVTVKGTGTQPDRSMIEWVECG